MFYAARGSIPHTRHTQHRAPDGSLYAEELFGVEGFTGRSSLLYHVTPPTRTHRIEPVATMTLDEADDGYHHHRLIDAAGDRAARRRCDRAHPFVLQQSTS
jgi:homogentisate 1,2-dioxygenase